MHLDSYSPPARLRCSASSDLSGFAAESATADEAGGLFLSVPAVVAEPHRPQPLRDNAAGITPTNSYGDEKARSSAADTSAAPPNGRVVSVAHAGKKSGRARGTKSLAYKTLPGWAKGMYSRVQKSAAARGLPFELTPKQFALIIGRAHGKCEISGVPFQFDGEKGRMRPFAPSLDRIDSERGYTVDNSRLVCVLANFAMNQWGLQPVITFASYLARNAIEAGQHEYKVKTGLISNGRRGAA